MSLDVPSTGASVQGNFAVSGWALDLSASSGSGVDTVHVWAQSVSSGEWSFLGAASMGVSRPDVAAAFQSQQFASSGYGMMAALPPGTYDINVFAHSVISNTFNNVQTKRITVVAPPSRPLMYIDLPVPNQNLSQAPFIISGWALDLSSNVGPGVDAIHVWAYPTAGGAPIFVAASTVGSARPDVGGLFGGQFTNSGYYLQGSLPAGDYNLVVFARSKIAQQFNNAALVHIVIR
jgi:hypothetical protein